MDQLAQPNEKGQLRNAQALVDENAFGGDEIRQIQMLMVLFSCLPPNGKVREVLEHALGLPQESWLSRLNPPKDMSFYGIKAWLESLWCQEGLTPAEQKLVTWQGSRECMLAAVQELKEAEQRIGLKLAVQRIS